jgi:hypothetical protein
MDASEFDWRGGTVSYWALGAVRPEVAISFQYADLKEDLAQVEFAPAAILDVGWYPSFSPEGRFVVMVVRSADWDSPAFRREFKDVAALRDAIRAAIDVAVLAGRVT